MATPIVQEGVNCASDASHQDQLTERELIVSIRPYKLNFWEYEGTRAQLEAEGVIPTETQWPIGAQRNYWSAGLFRFSLCRTRPSGLKGPMRTWVNGDWWCIRCELDGMDMVSGRVLDMKRELAEALYLETSAGQRERDERWDRYWQACEDKAFQRFKAAFVPEPKKRGRKAKVADAQQTQGGAA